VTKRTFRPLPAAGAVLSAVLSVGLGGCEADPVASAPAADSSDDVSFRAGDGLLAGDAPARALADLPGPGASKQLGCGEADVELPAGYVSFAQQEFASGAGPLRLQTSLEVEPQEGAFLRTHVSVTTELTQKHHSFDVAIAQGVREQTIEIPFEDLKLNELVEHIGTLAVTVELHEGSGHSTLHRAGHENAAGMHLDYHVDEQGLARAYAPRLRSRYLAAWKQGLERRLTLHATHPFSSGLGSERDDLEVSRASKLPTGAVSKSLVSNNVRLCPNMSVEFVDAGQGEDYWTSSGLTARSMYGAQYKVFLDGDLLVTGFLDEMEGCQNLFLTPNKTYDVEVWAKAEIWGNTYQVQNLAGQTRFKTFSVRPTSNTLTTFAPNLTDSNAQERWNIFEALIRSGRKHGIGDGHKYLFRYDPSYDAEWSGGEGHIGETQSGRKFIIAHEYGHGLQDVITGNMFPVDYEVGEDKSSPSGCDVSPIPDDDCRSHTGTGATDCTSGGQHKMWSLEHQASAANEGWAHFVSADVWNDHEQTDCAFGYWRQKGSTGYVNQALDCEAASTGFPVSFMRTECDTNSSDFGTKGVEVDWLRAFWDTHTNGTNPPGMGTMLDLLTVTGVTDTNVLSKLNTRANSLGGTLNSNWDAAASANGL
jgi:hypothetical protein